MKPRAIYVVANTISTETLIVSLATPPTCIALRPVLHVPHGIQTGKDGPVYRVRLLRRQRVRVHSLRRQRSGTTVRSGPLMRTSLRIGVLGSEDRGQMLISRFNRVRDGNGVYFKSIKQADCIDDF